MRIDLQGRTALVLGGTRGLGWGCAQALDEAGARVILNGRDAGHGQAAAGRLSRPITTSTMKVWPSSRSRGKTP